MEEASAFAFPLLPLVLFSGSFFPFFFFLFFSFFFLLLVKFVKWLSSERLQAKTWGPALRDSLSAPPPRLVIWKRQVRGQSMAQEA